MQTNKRKRYQRAVIVCPSCERKQVERGRGMCGACYKYVRRAEGYTPPKPKRVKCCECRRMLPHKARGKCEPCYQRMRYHARKLVA